MAEQAGSTPEGPSDGTPGSTGAQALDEVVRFTSELIGIDTTNRGGGDCQERPAAEYAAARLAEAGIEPTLLERTEGRTNVVARIEGTDPSAGALLVHGHLDVVPAEAADWSVHPFSGEIRDGVVWGRGAVDMKNMDAMILAVVRDWARQGVRPRRDVVIAFTADEEASAEDGSGFLADRHAALFEGCTEGVSESGAFTFHDGAGRQFYPIAAGERGTGWLKLAARGRAGHGSKVNRENAVTRLAAAITRIGDHEWPLRLTPTVRAALTELAAVYGIETDLRDIDALLDKLGPAAGLVEATVRNSSNPTMLDAGYKVNVIPSEAVAYVDGRFLHGCEDEFRNTLDRLTGPDVDWEFAPPRGRPPGAGGLADLRPDACRRRGVRPRGACGAVLHVRRHGRQAVLAARHHRLRVRAAEAARGLRLPGPLPRRRRTCPRRGAALRRPRPRPIPAHGVAGRPFKDPPDKYLEEEKVGESVRTLPYGSWPSPIDAALAAAHDGAPTTWPSSATRCGGRPPGPRRAVGARWCGGVPTAPRSRCCPRRGTSAAAVIEYGGRPWAALMTDTGPLVVFDELRRPAAVRLPAGRRRAASADARLHGGRRAALGRAGGAWRARRGVVRPGGVHR